MGRKHWTLEKRPSSSALPPSMFKVNLKTHKNFNPSARCGGGDHATPARITMNSVAALLEAEPDLQP